MKKEESSEFSKIRSSKRLVVGLGTGRSGTVSLSKFLDAQEKSFFVHEGAYKLKFLFRHAAGNYLPWKINNLLFEEWYTGLTKASKDARYYGDICASLLPYVPSILEKDPEAIFVCMKRNKKDVVDSFMHVTTGINYWDKNETFREVDFWGEMFPTIDSSNKRESIERYWDMYYETIESLEQKYPNAVRTFSINDLNTTEGRDRILDYIGYPKNDRRVDKTFHANKRLNLGFITILRMFMFTYAYFAKIGPHVKLRPDSAKDPKD